MTPPRGPKPPAISLSPTERQELEALLRRPSTPQQAVTQPGDVYFTSATFSYDGNGVISRNYSR